MLRYAACAQLAHTYARMSALYARSAAAVLLPCRALCHDTRSAPRAASRCCSRCLPPRDMRRRLLWLQSCCAATLVSDTSFAMRYAAAAYDATRRRYTPCYAFTLLLPPRHAATPPDTIFFFIDASVAPLFTLMPLCCFCLVLMLYVYCHIFARFIFTPPMHAIDAAA